MRGCGQKKSKAHVHIHSQWLSQWLVQTYKRSHTLMSSPAVPLPPPNTPSTLSEQPQIQVHLQVTDPHSVTPSCFLEVAAGSAHTHQPTPKCFAPLPHPHNSCQFPIADRGALASDRPAQRHALLLPGGGGGQRACAELSAGAQQQRGAGPGVCRGAWLHAGVLGQGRYRAMCGVFQHDFSVDRCAAGVSRGAWLHAGGLGWS